MQHDCYRHCGSNGLERKEGIVFQYFLFIPVMKDVDSVVIKKSRAKNSRREQDFKSK
jgi:hypothetical protein